MLAILHCTKCFLQEYNLLSDGDHLIAHCQGCNHQVVLAPNSLVGALDTADEFGFTIIKLPEKRGMTLDEIREAYPKQYAEAIRRHTLGGMP